MITSNELIFTGKLQAIAEMEAWKKNSGFL